MSVASGLLVSYGRLDVFSALTEQARRASLDAGPSSKDAVERLLQLLEPQERQSASLDALEFQTLLKSRCGVTDGELEGLRRAMSAPTVPEQSRALLTRISNDLARERSALASRISGG